MKIIREHIFESVQSQDDLEILSSILLKRMTERAMEYHSSNQEKRSEYTGYKDFVQYYYLSFLMPVLLRYDDIKYSKKLSKEFLSVFKEAKNVRVEFDKYIGKKRGEYDSYNDIVIFVEGTDPDLTDAVEFNRETLWNHIFKKYKYTLMHELQHFYDKWRSKGKYIENPLSQKVVNKFIKHTDAEYAKSQHEISARFTSAITDLRNDRDMYRGSFTDLLTKFKTRIGGWEHLDNKDKQRLINRLSIEFHRKDRSLQSDITDKLEYYKNKFKEEGYFIQIFNHENKYIDIAHLEGEDINKVIEKMIYLGDIYKLDVIIDPNQIIFNNKLNRKQFLEYIKKLGFVENNGKHLRHDLDYDEWYRIHKRKNK